MAVDPIIQFERATFRFHGGIVALNEVDLNITEGECVGIVGPNGGGKTTLFLTMIGIRQATGGKVTVAGLDVGDKHNCPAISTTVGMVFQQPDDQLFCATVLDDVAFGPLNQGLDPDQVRERVAWALDRVGMGNTEDRVPHHLSAGEKRRVSIATVLAMKPRVLVLDEPTNDLDPRGRRQLIDLVNDLDQTKLIASHDLEFVLETCQRVVVFDGGRIVADGEPTRILTDADIVAKHGLEIPPSLNGR